ncbi:DegT/DnrJ/EryC1/StrS family aminotransferase, partial [Candidatus Micrarchaeota archaeon]|nr:DegT/DnrJ/EryC1/StrS family aminotransferase [Candidatus Micrarchaeota archaeon]
QPLYKEMFGFKEEDLPVTMKAWNKLIDIPLWAELGEEKQDVVIEALLELLE